MRKCDICRKTADGQSASYKSSEHFLMFDLCEPCDVKVTRRVMKALADSKIPADLLPEEYRPTPKKRRTTCTSSRR